MQLNVVVHACNSSSPSGTLWEAEPRRTQASPGKHEIQSQNKSKERDRNVPQFSTSTEEKERRKTKQINKRLRGIVQTAVSREIDFQTEFDTELSNPTLPGMHKVLN